MSERIITCGIFLYSGPRKKILICHPTHARWNQWSIPKGLIEPGEEDYTAAVRELFEETGIEIGTLGKVIRANLPDVDYRKQKKTLRSFLVITNHDLDHHVFKSQVVENLNVPEIDLWKWISLDDAGKFLHETQNSLIGIIRELLKKGERPSAGLG
jgi:8-oxo-dGTP pyrophosphatase MutT (NUDIX family)